MRAKIRLEVKLHDLYPHKDSLSLTLALKGPGWQDTKGLAGTV